MKAYFKDYFYRITHECKKWELVYWWILRATMIFAMADSVFGLGFMRDEPDVQQMLQTFANFVGMFAWEILLLFSDKHWPRYVPSHFQDGMIALLWLGSFGGAYINLYYKLNSYDYIMHFVLGFYAVIIGYEIVTAIQKRDKKVSDLPILLFAAFGFSFILGTGWELFEFTFDQVAGGDSQHWSQELARQAADMYNNPGLAKPYILNPASYAPRIDGEYYTTVEQVFNSRYAVIDTMEDIIFNTLGAIAAYITLKIKPYHHSGKNNVNNMFSRKEKEEANVR